MAILIGNRRDWQRPPDFECRIVVPYTSGLARRVDRRGEIVDLGIVLQRLTAVGAALRYVEHVTVVRAQARPVPGPVGRRSGPKIHHDVEDRTPRAANELGLERGGDLIVQSTDRALPDAERHVRLQRGEIDGMFGKLGAAPRAHEPAPRVFMRCRLDDPGTIDSTLRELHRPRALAIAPGHRRPTAYSSPGDHCRTASRCMTASRRRNPPLSAPPDSETFVRGKDPWRPGRYGTSDTTRQPDARPRRSPAGNAIRDGSRSW